MRLTVVRHGETIENAGDIIMGQNGGTLSKKGVEQAKMTAQTLEDEIFDQAWSSDLKRCVDTAKYILEPHPDLSLQVTPALREVNYGEFQGRPGAEIRAFFDQEGGFNQKLKVPGGESHIEMAERVLHFVNDLFRQFPKQKILLVSHNGPIETIRAAIEKTPFSGDPKNASIWRCVIKEALQLYPTPETYVIK